MTEATDIRTAQKNFENFGSFLKQTGFVDENDQLITTTGRQLLPGRGVGDFAEAAALYCDARERIKSASTQAEGGAKSAVKHINGVIRGVLETLTATQRAEVGEHLRRDRNVVGYLISVGKLPAASDQRMAA